MEPNASDFRRKLDALIGQPTGGSGKPTVAPDPVNQPMIRHWCHALDDMNPVYLDPDFAAQSRFGGIVSPPAMLQAWTMPAPKLEGIAERGGVPIEMGKNPAAFIEEAGFTGIVATNSEFEIERYPRLGDVISVTQVFEDISDEKKTSLGIGHFITWLSTYTDQHGEVLGRQRFRVFRFQGRQLMATRLAPTVSPDTEFFWTGLRDHKLLIQRCTGCQALRQPPRPMCPACNSLDWDTVESSGRGRVYSYVMPQHPPMPFMEYPYIVALIELDEGVRLVSNLCDIAPDDVEVGMPVEVFYEMFDSIDGNDVVLHQFRPAH